MRQVWALLIGSVLSAGCSVLNPYACIYETRFVATSGTASASGGGTVIVESLNFRENTPEAQTPVVITWRIQAQDLAAAPIRLTLREARNPGQVLHSLVTSSTGVSATAISSASSLEIPPAERDQMFNLLNGNGIVVLELANGSSTTVPLTVAAREDWHRPSCD